MRYGPPSSLLRYSAQRTAHHSEWARACTCACTHTEAHTLTLTSPPTRSRRRRMHKHLCIWKTDALNCVLTLRGSVLHDLGLYGALNHFCNWGPQCHHQQCSSATQADAGPQPEPGATGSEEPCAGHHGAGVPCSLRRGRVRFSAWKRPAQTQT